MSREVHVRFCEGPGVQFPRPTLHLVGFTGPKAEAEEIKARLAAFVRETLGLELNQAKTLITHARTQRARFLGYDLTVQHSSTKSPGTGDRSTGKSRCGCRRTWSRPSAPATGDTANRGTGPGSRTSTTTTSSEPTEPNIAASSTT
ncbi:MAG TPA: hypothetical protein VF788_08560, partial [Pseudonocardiaceae bacterium]